MARNVKRIHIFSSIPNLYSLVMKEIPKTTIINVVNENNDPVLNNWKRQKVVSREEFSEIKNAEIILGDENLISQVYENLPNAKFVQCTRIGFEMLTENVKKDRIPMYPIARLGIQKFSQYMAEYILGQILAHERDWFGAHHYQLEKTWAHKDKIAFYKSLQQISVGILGIGTIGFEVIRSLKFFGCKVLNLGKCHKTLENVPQDEYFTTDQLPLFLEKCDYLVSIPLTSNTKGLLGKDVLRFAKKKLVFINIGCGDIISEDEILTALDNSWISTAILDVFGKEPLSDSSQLWNHSKVIVTPHIAAIDKPEDIVQDFLDNLKRYTDGDSLLNLINWDADCE